MFNPPGICKYILWFWLNQLTGETRPYHCRSWHCPDSQHRWLFGMSWAVRVARALPERMVTLTNIPKDRHVAYLAFQRLVRDLRALGICFEYVRFFEVGSRTGMHHYHLGQRGDFVPVRLLSARAAANGLGKVVDIRACHGEGPSWYMTKYIAKGLDTLPEGCRKVASSRRFFAKEPPAEPEPGWTLVKPGTGLYGALRGA